MNKYLYDDLTTKIRPTPPQEECTRYWASKQQHDAHRDRYLSELNIRVVGFWNPDKSGQNIEGVGKRIKEEAEKHS
jgi:very-short-patch-repair endonuclease